MDGTDELRTRIHNGITAFRDGKYDECLRNIGQLLKYFATDQMMLVVLISLQRVGNQAQLEKFVDDCSGILAYQPDLRRLFAITLGQESGEVALESAADAIESAQFRYYLAAYHMSSP